MKPEANTKKYEPYRIVMFVAALAGVVALAIKMKEVFASLTIAVFFFYLLDPIACFLTGKRIGKKVVISRFTASSLALLIGVLIISVLLILLIPAIYEQVERFGENIPVYTQKAEEAFTAIQQKYHRMQLPPSVQESVTKSVDRMVSGSSNFVKGAMTGMGHFFSQIILIFMIPFLTYYMLVEKYDMKKTIISFFPKRYQQEIGQVVGESSRTLRGYIYAQMFLSIFMTIFMAIGLAILGVKAPLLLGLITGISVMIPVVGVIFASIPAAFVALSTSTELAIWVIIIFTIIQLLKSKFVMPLFFSKYVDLSPLAILLALVVGEKTGGVLGMFLATPVAAMLKVIYKHLRTRYE